MTLSQPDFFYENEPIWKNYLPLIEKLSDGDTPKYIWDIPYTINQLSYLSHSHFRYYGKFPSVVAGQVIDEYYPKNSKRPIFDNFCGSGTTLVEASLRNIQSVGVDVSWLSCLSSNVKVTHINLDDVSNLLNKIQTRFEPTFLNELSEREEKWFEPNAIASLKTIQKKLLEFEINDEVKFLIIAFLAIIRRTSRAFDAEVRPHINKNKKYRDPLGAFTKKVNDMIRNHKAFQSFTSPKNKHECLLGDAREVSKFYNYDPPALVISHPPYLNAFNYSPVFSLEYMWGQPFEKALFKNLDFQKRELVAHPANEKNIKNYFDFLSLAYKETYDLQKKGDTLAIVIGDCTRNKQLIPVIDTLIDTVSNIGYVPIAINYRTTHYGTGKYAYNTRANYHKGVNAKKDGILIFRKCFYKF